MDRDTLRQWTNLLAIIAAIVFNIVTNFIPFNNLSIQKIADTYSDYIAVIPADYAFAIWGLIYLGLLGLGIYQVLPANKTEPRCRQLGYYLTVASLSQMAWIVFFQYELFWLSVLAMLGILIPLILLYLKLGIALQPVSRVQKWLINFPISIYTAWISVATILNVAIALTSVKWNGWNISFDIWTIVLLLVATAIATLVTTKRRDIAFTGVIIWAFVAIALRNLEELNIAATAFGLALFLGLLFVRQKSAKPRYS
jgi:hypothetical protein